MICLCRWQRKEGRIASELAVIYRHAFEIWKLTFGKVVTPPKPSSSISRTWYSLYPTDHHMHTMPWYKLHYYSFKIFSRFWLVKTTSIIHHNQIFAILHQWRQKCIPRKIIELMTSKWRQKCSPLQIIEPLTEKTWGQGCVIFGERKKQRALWRNSFKKEEIFWMNNKAIIEFGFRRIWRILQISEGVIHLGLRPLGITPSSISRLLHILLSRIQ